MDRNIFITHMKNKSSKDDIFIKYENIEQNDQGNENTSLSKEEILKSIPENALKVANNELTKTHIEWRWRIFEIPNRANKLIEMSFKKPNDQRMYINKSGSWVNSEVGKEYDKFVVDEYYSYSQFVNQN